MVTEDLHDFGHRPCNLEHRLTGEPARAPRPFERVAICSAMIAIGDPLQ
jgi:hypothetical protein